MSTDTAIDGKVESAEVRIFEKPVPFAVLYLNHDGGVVKFFLNTLDDVRTLAERILAECDRLTPNSIESVPEREPKSWAHEGTGNNHIEGHCEIANTLHT